jgi:hypothetical protein
MPCLGERAQQAHPADAAVRPQDRVHFERWNQSETSTDLQVRRG